MILVDESIQEIHQSLILVDESIQEIHQSFILVDESIQEIHQSFILVDESIEEIHHSLILIDESIQEIHQLFGIAIAFLVLLCFTENTDDICIFAGDRTLPHLYNQSIDLEVFALLLARLVQHPNPMLALFVPHLSLILTVWV